MTTTPARDVLAQRIDAAVKTVLSAASSLTHTEAAAVVDAVMPVLDTELAAQRAELTDLLSREKDRADAAIEREETAEGAAAEVRAAALGEAADYLRDAHFRDGMSLQEIGVALRRMAAAARPDNTTLRTAIPGEPLPDADPSCYPPDAVPLPDARPDNTTGA